MRLWSRPGMEMTRGGMIDPTTKRYQPDMKRADIREFVDWATRSGASEQLANDFLLKFLGSGGFRKEPPAPRPEEDLCAIWGIDDDREDIINAVLERSGRSRIRWNEPSVLQLRTVGDLFMFVQSKTGERPNDDG